jgi:hypothetical protein
MKFGQNHSVRETEEKGAAIIFDPHTDRICIIRQATVR